VTLTKVMPEVPPTVGLVSGISVRVSIGFGSVCSGCVDGASSPLAFVEIVSEAQIRLIL
jgi:hypothetical protein